MNLSKHAKKRCFQRGINQKDIQFVYEFGTYTHKTGALFVFLRKQDLPKNMQQQNTKKLEGITILLNPKTKEIITVYKNKNAFKDIKKKSKICFSKRKTRFQ